MVTLVAYVEVAVGSSDFCLGAKKSETIQMGKRLVTRGLQSKLLVNIGREPWSSGYGRRLMF